MSDLGSVVIAGTAYGITGLALRDGELVITAGRRGPVPAVTDEPVTIFGADGTGFGQGGKISHAAARPGEQVAVTLKVRLLTVE